MTRKWGVVGLAVIAAIGFFVAGFCVRGLDRGKSATCIILEKQVRELYLVPPSVAEGQTREQRQFYRGLVEQYDDECRRKFWLF